MSSENTQTSSELDSRLRGNDEVNRTLEVNLTLEKHRIERTRIKWNPYDAKTKPGRDGTMTRRVISYPLPLDGGGLGWG